MKPMDRNSLRAFVFLSREEMNESRFRKFDGTERGKICRHSVRR